MNYTRLVDILERCRKKRLLVVGDVMLDTYIDGRVERICPEAPVQVVRIHGEQAMLGGCGNVARNLTPFGVQIDLCAVVGGDDAGRHVRELLAADGIGARGVFVDRSRPTTTKTRVTAERQQILRLDREETAPVSGDAGRRLARWLGPAVARAHVVLMSDYAKGLLTERIRETVFRAADKAGVPVVVDPKLPDLRGYRGATVLKPNVRETSSAWGRPIGDQADLERAGRSLRRSSGCDALVITRGPQPTAVFEKGRRVEYIPTLAREVYDVSGAGDTMLALIGLGLAAGASCFEAVRLANIGAGVVVGKVGTARAEEAEILAHAAADHDPSARKAIAPERLAPILAEHRRQGHRIVFTNGCFDLLHAGHIRFFQQARKLGHLLVVGLNSDVSVRRIKGYPRPFLKQAERIRILTALDCVDYVVVFDEPTPRRLLRRLKPDILVKGRERSLDSVVGKDIVESYGGRVRVLQTFEGPTITELSREIYALLDRRKAASPSE
jgi:D-beta-D-heptose 7-phosphate kinase/D-beta-D-heptose 1-phosphate adenosyltransferase